MEKRRICCFCEKWASGGIESFLTDVLSRLDLRRLADCPREDAGRRLTAAGYDIGTVAAAIQRVYCDETAQFGGSAGMEGGTA